MTTPRIHDRTIHAPPRVSMVRPKPAMSDAAITRAKRSLRRYRMPETGLIGWTSEPDARAVEAETRAGHARRHGSTVYRGQLHRLQEAGWTDERIGERIGGTPARSVHRYRTGSTVAGQAVQDAIAKLADEVLA